MKSHTANAEKIKPGIITVAKQSFEGYSGSLTTIKDIDKLQDKINELERHIRILANPYCGEKW